MLRRMPDSFRPAPLGAFGFLANFASFILSIFASVSLIHSATWGGSLLDREVGAMQVLRYFSQPRAGVIAIDINCVNIVTI